jgi:hypothetical protein
MSVPGSEAYVFAVSLHDARSGKQLATLTCHPAGGGVELKEARLEWQEVGTGKLSRVLPDWAGPLCFSPDGRLLATSRSKKDDGGGTHTRITVCNAATGQELKTLSNSVTITLNDAPGAAPWEFSPDGRFLLDTLGRVWEVGTGNKLMDVTGTGIGNAHFTQDGSYLVVFVPSGSFLTYHNLLTGREETERRVSLNASGLVGQHSLSLVDPDERLLMVQGVRSSGMMEKLLDRLRELTGISNRRVPRQYAAFVIVEAASGRQIQSGDGYATCCSHDGRHLIVANNGVTEVWEVPPYKPLRWLLPAAAIWTAVVGLVAWWRLRREKSSSTLVASTTEAATS